jgi:Crinkler effector protein N-terminal domain
MAIFPVSAPPLSLNCFILGNDLNWTFTVEILKAKNVSILKDLIKEKNPSSFGNVDARNISLWQVSFSINNLPSKNPPTVGPKLRLEKLLLDVFLSELDINHIHVVACVLV